MKTFIILLLIALLCFSGSATTFTEFFVNPNAAAGCTNVNSGSTSTGTALYTSTATVAGGWNGTSVFTPDDGSTPASTVSAGMFASVYTNGVNTNAVFVARITSVAAGVNGAITIDTTAKMGTAPGAVLGAVAAITIKVGGTWKGPYEGGSTSVTFPFNFAAPNATNTDGSMVCINFIGGTNYTITNSITHSINGPMRWEGYTNAPHDSGMATISGGTVVAGFTLATLSGTRNDWCNFVWMNNGASGASDGVVLSGSGSLFFRNVITGMRRIGLNLTGTAVVSECEATTNNVNNSAGGIGAFYNAVAGSTWIRCTAYNNTNSNTSGFLMVQPATYITCFAFNNGLAGLECQTTGDPIVLVNCDFYRNRVYGFDMSAGAPAVSQLVYIENSNFITNGAIGVNSSTIGTKFKRNGGFYNLGFGSGTKTNASGSFGANMTNVFQAGIITYASDVTPWVAPDSGNFKINLAAAYGTGRGSFTETAVGVSGTIGFPSIGAAQPAGFTNPVPFGVISQ